MLEGQVQCTSRAQGIAAQELCLHLTGIFSTHKKNILHVKHLQRELLKYMVTNLSAAKKKMKQGYP